MSIVAAKNRVNRPFFFSDVDGNRVVVPAFGTGQFDLDVVEKAKFDAVCAGGQMAHSDHEPIVEKPVNTVEPSIVGAPEVGATLTVYDGEWTGDPVFTYVWHVEDDEASTDSEFLLLPETEGSRIKLSVTATNSAGSTTFTTDYIGPVTE